MVVKFWSNRSETTYNGPNLEPMQLAFFLAGEITQVKESIPWVRCASGNVSTMFWQKYWNQCFSNISITSAWWIYNRAPQLLSELKQGLQVFVFWVKRETPKTQQTGVYWFLAVIFWLLTTFANLFLLFLRTMFPPAVFPPLPSLLSGGRQDWLAYCAHLWLHCYFYTQTRTCLCHNYILRSSSRNCSSTNIVKR